MEQKFYKNFSSKTVDNLPICSYNSFRNVHEHTSGLTVITVGDRNPTNIKGGLYNEEYSRGKIRNYSSK